MKLFYHTFGEGPPLIILHGLYGLSDNWVTIAKRAAANYKVYIPDQRNHGRSPHHSTFNYYALADDLMEFMEAHNIEQPVLMGHSMGGKVAIHFALDYPEDVEKLIVVDMGVRKYKAKAIHYQLIEAMESVDFDQAGTRDEVEQQLGRYVQSRPLRMFLMKNLKRYSRQRLGWKLNLPVLKASMENIVEGISTENQFKKPTLFIAGGKSDYVLEEDHPKIKEIFPSALIKTIPGASHWLHVEAPEVFCEILSNFLQKDCKSMDDLLNESRSA
ncbi:MAG: alpha/beta fold hydrolase [Bacteroidales bacterium]